MRELELTATSSRSLLNNVLDSEDDFILGSNNSRGSFNQNSGLFATKSSARFNSLDLGGCVTKSQMETDLGAILDEIKIITDKIKEEVLVAYSA